MQIALARGLAETCTGTAVTVNSVLPGPTRSEGVIQFVADLPAQPGRGHRRSRAGLLCHGPAELAPAALRGARGGGFSRDLSRKPARLRHQRCRAPRRWRRGALDPRGVDDAVGWPGGGGDRRQLGHRARHRQGGGRRGCQGGDRGPDAGEAGSGPARAGASRRGPSPGCPDEPPPGLLPGPGAARSFGRHRRRRASLRPLQPARPGGLPARLEGKFWAFIHATRHALATLRKDGSITLVTGAPARAAMPGTAGVAAVNGALQSMAPTSPASWPRSASTRSRPAWWRRRSMTACPECPRCHVPPGRRPPPRPPHRAAEDLGAAALFLMTNGYTTGTILDWRRCPPDQLRDWRGPHQAGPWTHSARGR